MVKANPQERQAKISVAMGAIGGLFAVLAAFFVLQNLNLEHFEIRYNPRGLRFPLIMVTIGLAALAATIGVFAGFNSAGHKRNKLSRLSWAGFFASAIALTVSLSVLVFFWLAKEAVIFQG